MFLTVVLLKSEPSWKCLIYNYWLLSGQCNTICLKLSQMNTFNRFYCFWSSSILYIYQVTAHTLALGPFSKLQTLITNEASKTFINTCLIQYMYFSLALNPLMIIWGTWLSNDVVLDTLLHHHHCLCSYNQCLNQLECLSLYISDAMWLLLLLS